MKKGIREIVKIKLLLNFLSFKYFNCFPSLSRRPGLHYKVNKVNKTCLASALLGMCLHLNMAPADVRAPALLPQLNISGGEG